MNKYIFLIFFLFLQLNCLYGEEIKADKSFVDFNKIFESDKERDQFIEMFKKVSGFRLEILRADKSIIECRGYKEKKRKEKTIRWQKIHFTLSKKNNEREAITPVLFDKSRGKRESDSSYFVKSAINRDFKYIFRIQVAALPDEKNLESPIRKDYYKISFLVNNRIYGYMEADTEVWDYNSFPPEIRVYEKLLYLFLNKEKFKLFYKMYYKKKLKHPDGKIIKISLPENDDKYRIDEINSSERWKKNAHEIRFSNNSCEIRIGNIDHNLFREKNKKEFNDSIIETINLNGGNVLETIEVNVLKETTEIYLYSVNGEKYFMGGVLKKKKYPFFIEGSLNNSPLEIVKEELKSFLSEIRSYYD